MNVIPQELKKLNIWHCWKLIGVNTKLPVQVNGEPAKSNDPGTWTDYETALEASKQFTGLVLEIVDPYCGVDLDECINDAGEVRPWAAEILERFKGVAYAEVSPSKTGIKLITRARKPSSTKCKHVIHGDQQIECYDNRRFWTVTGDVINEQTEILDGSEAIDWLREKYLKIEQRPVTQRKSLPTGSSLRDRARAYVDSVPYQGGGRNNAVFSLAGHLYAMSGELGERLGVTEVQDLMRYWNSKLGEPLSDRELMTATDSAGRNGTAREPKPPKGPERYLDADLSGLNFAAGSPEGEPTQIRTFGGVSAADIWEQALEPVEWLVKDVFSVDQPTIFGAKQKSLKTTTLADLSIALATGFPWLGKFEIPKKRRVLLISGESSQNAAIRKVRKAAEQRNVAPEDIGDRIRIESNNFPTLPSLEDCMSISRSVEEYEIDVVIVDPLYMGLEGLNTANLTEVGPAMRRFMQACRPANVIIAHHVKKSASYDDAPNLEDLSQAGIAEFAGNYWLMGRMSEYQGDGCHELAIRYGGRDEQFGLLKLEFNERDWTARFSSLQDHREFKKQSKENEKVVRMKQRAVRAMERSPDGMSEAKLAEACGTKPVRETFQVAMDELVSHGTFRRDEGFKSGSRTCLGYQLVC